MPASTLSPSAPNSGPRWSIVGRLMARRMRSGTGLGPGICRKWRPRGWKSRSIIGDPLRLDFCIQNAYSRASKTLIPLAGAGHSLHAKFGRRRSTALAQVIEISRLALHDQVAARLRTMLVEGRIAPGAKLLERELCAQLRVSRTPLREAIKLLGAEGLVDLLPNRGAVAVKLSEVDVLNAFEVLALLEGASGELAAERIGEAELAEVRALHFEMMACFTRRDL